MTRISDWDSHIGRRIKLRDLYVFFVVVQQGSLSKAAAQLGVSHPAISQLIANLEQDVGAELLERSSRGVTPTVYGNALLARGRAAFDELKNGIQEIQCLADPEAGEVRVGCPEGLEAILLPAIETFSRRYPRVIIDIHVEELETLAAKLHARSLDFVLQLLRGYPRINDPFFDELKTEILFEDELIVAAGGKSPWSRRTKIDLSELADEPWILTAPPSWNHGIIAEAFHARGLPMPNVVIKTFSTYIRTHLVASGRFIATFPKSVADFYAKRFLLKVLPVELPDRPWPVAILTLKNRKLGPAAYNFLTHVRDQTREVRNRKGASAHSRAR